MRTVFDRRTDRVDPTRAGDHARNIAGQPAGKMDPGDAGAVQLHHAGIGRTRRPDTDHGGFDLPAEIQRARGLVKTSTFLDRPPTESKLGATFREGV